MRINRLSSSPSSVSQHTIESCSARLFTDDIGLGDWHKRYVSTHKIRLALDLDIVKENVAAGSRVLDMGSAPFVLTAALLKSKYEVTGCDIAPERYASAIEKMGLDVARCDIETEKLPFPDNTFDAVVFNELFEHLRINPVFTLSEVLRVAKPGGILMLSSPNLRSLGGIRNFLFRNRAFSCSGDVYGEFKKLEKLGHMGHVREYTTVEVEDFLQNVGFETIALIFRGQYGSGLAQFVIKAIPSLSPFVSYVAIKPATTVVKPEY